MGWWEIGADTLASGRFVVSPLAETIACLKTLHAGAAAHPGERAWLDAYLPAYRERLARDAVTALLVRAALGPTWNADFLTPTPAGEGEPGFEDELEAVLATPPEAAREQLVVSLGGPLPPALHRSDLPVRLAGLLRWIWTRTVLPTWPRRRRVLEADVVARTARLGQGGWAAALGDMRPGMRWLGGSRLQVNTHDYPPRDLAGARLLFVPVTPRRTWVSWEAPHRYAVVYPCAGPLADAAGSAPPGRGPDGGAGPAAGGPSVPAALGALLGPARARVLVLLADPKSTSQLVALTGQGLGSVGRHLKVLLDARLAARRRAGRSVLYYRTAAGDTLVGAQD
ncbi:transcriptional regulator [Nonomuraea pusilla]|uniref:transcriptional regulator n=1 Tax=Nonomuraea pusilla TaxID=46177 RepID=UPI00331C3555